MKTPYREPGFVLSEPEKEKLMRTAVWLEILKKEVIPVALKFLILMGIVFGTIGSCHYLFRRTEGECTIETSSGRLLVQSTKNGKAVPEAFFDKRTDAIEYMKTLPHCNVKD